MYRVFILSFFLILAGCAENDGIFPTTSSYALIHGEEASDAEYGATVAISVKSGDNYRAYCTGILIEEDVVLTAAHCVSDTPDMPFSQLYENNKISVIVAQDASNPETDRIFTLKDIYVHFLYHYERSVHDLALIRLDRPVPETLAQPIPYAPYSAETRHEMYYSGKVTFVGYGVDEMDGDNKRLFYTGQIYDYCPMIGNPEDCYLKLPNGEMMQIPVGTLMYDLEKGGPCSGDSGGPVLTELDGNRYVIGIISFGDANCSVYSVSSSIPDHSEWIEETLHPKPKKDSCSTMTVSKTESGIMEMFLLLLLSCLLNFIKKMRINTRNYKI